MKCELGLAFRPLQCRVKHLQRHVLWLLDKCNFCFIQSLLVPWTYHVHSLFVSLLSPTWFYLSFPLFLKNPLSTFQGPVQVHSLRPLPSSIPWLSQSMELSPSFFFFGLRACGILVPWLWIKPMAQIRGPCSGRTVLPTGPQGKSLSLLLISVVHTVCSIPIWHLAYIILLYAHLSIYLYLWLHYSLIYLYIVLRPWHLAQGFAQSRNPINVC